jgi:chromosomal replication initiator protein
MTAYTAPGILNAKDPFKIVSRLLNVPIDDIKSKSRKRELITARNLICYHYKTTRIDYTLEKIGHLIGNKDHATVLHGLKTYNNLYQTDKQFKELADKFNEQMYTPTKEEIKTLEQ